MNRRTVLRSAGLACAVGLAGCSEGPDSGSGTSRSTTARTSEPGPEPESRTATDSKTSSEGDPTTERGDTDTDADTDTDPNPDPEPRSGTTLSGLAIDATPAALATLGPYERWATQRPATVTTFVNGLESPDGVEQFVEKRLTPIWERGGVPIVTWMPAYTNPPENSDPAVDRRIRAGEYDRIIEKWATSIEEWVLGPEGERTPQRRIYLRPAHEMNGNWFPWSATDSESTPADYIGMWRRVHDIFTGTAMESTHLQWIWAPNADEVGDIEAEQYYPGDEYVDWLGLDGFNFGDVESWSDWRSPEELFGGMLGRIRAIADKPVALTEFASTSFIDGTYRPEMKARWIRDVFSMIEREGIAMACWFDIDKRGEDESDWAVFGGDRGTAMYTDLQTVERYPVYEGYKEVVRSPWVLPARSEYPRMLTDREFAGRLDG